MGSKDDAIAFIHKINNDRALQARLDEIAPRDWEAFGALAQESGFDVDRVAFLTAASLPAVGRFCSALTRFAGQLYIYKM